MDYRDALEYLDSHLNLEARQVPIAGQMPATSNQAISELLSVLGNPQDNFRSIHITGTNGKGSTAAAAAAFLAATDLSVGVYSSPHLAKPNERLKWNGEEISDEAFARVIELIASVQPMVSHELSWFEILTAAAFVWFSEMAVDVAVIEVGLLGTYDATNVVDADVAVITNVGKDHTNGEGAWASKIAEEKAGIIKPNSTVVIGADMGELAAIFEAKSARKVLWAHTDFSVSDNLLSVGGRLVDLQTPHSNHEELFIPFMAGYQADNILTGLVAVEAFFDRAIERDIVEFALTQLRLPARFEVVTARPVTVLDGFHNEDGAKATAQALGEGFAKLGSWVLIIGMLKDKSPTEVLVAAQLDMYDAIICCQPNSPRAFDAAELAQVVKDQGYDAEVIHQPLDAYRRARSICADEDLIMVGGSLYMLSEIKQWVVEQGPDTDNW